MILPEGRVGPYVRALRAAVHALAPHSDYPPMSEMEAHLTALDPGFSGDLLAPAEVDPQTGMPAWPWMERAIAEYRLVQDGTVAADPSMVARAEKVDPELAARLKGRVNLYNLMSTRGVLPSLRLQSRARRLRHATEVLLNYDRIRPDGLWERLHFLLSTAEGNLDLGCVRVESSGQVHVDAGLQHLLSRHASTPLASLHAQISGVTIGVVRRAARSTVGPFWFPGIQPPPGVPPQAMAGLTLHASTQVIGDEVVRSVDHDPLVQAEGLALPPGFHEVRSRRFACRGAVGASIRDWAHPTVADIEVVAF